MASMTSLLECYKTTPFPSHQHVDLNAVSQMLDTLSRIPEPKLAAQSPALQAIKCLSSTILPMPKQDIDAKIAELQDQRELEEELYGPLEVKEDSPYKVLNSLEELGEKMHTVVEAVSQISLTFPMSDFALFMKTQESLNQG